MDGGVGTFWGMISGWGMGSGCGSCVSHHTLEATEGWPGCRGDGAFEMDLTWISPGREPGWDI